MADTKLRYKLSGRTVMKFDTTNELSRRIFAALTKEFGTPLPKELGASVSVHTERIIDAESIPEAGVELSGDGDWPFEPSASEDRTDAAKSVYGTD